MALRKVKPKARPSGSASPNRMVSESAKRLSPGLEWGPQNDAGYDDPGPSRNDFRAASVLGLRPA